jgi:hypothetical protein
MILGAVTYMLAVESINQIVLISLFSGTRTKLVTMASGKNIWIIIQVSRRRI